MSKSSMAKTGRIQFDGSVLITQFSGYNAWATSAVSNKGNFVAPCDLILVGLYLYFQVAPTSANAKFNIGKQADSDYFVDAFPCQNLLGFVEVPLTDATVVQKIARKGDVVTMEGELATAVGDFQATAIWAPYPGTSA